MKRVIFTMCAVGLIFFLAMRNEEAASRVQELSFRRLRVEEAERQAGSNPKSEGTIKAQERVFTDAESWRAFWSAYGDAPEVDFKTHRVAAVFLGAKPNPGYGVRISRIVYDARRRMTTVHFVETLPDAQMGYADVIVYPSDIVAFPVKPGKVRFVRSGRR